MAQAETPHAAPGRGVHRHPCNTCGCLVWGHFLYSRSQLNEDDGRLRPAPGLCVLHTGSASGTARPWCVLFPAPFRTQALTVGRSCGAPSHGLLLPGHAFLPLPVPMSVPRPLLPLPPQACGEHPVLGASSFPPAALLHLVRGMEAAGNFHFIIEGAGRLVPATGKLTNTLSRQSAEIHDNAVRCGTSTLTLTMGQLTASWGC
ncbi:uncharacterized protein LOC104854393 isoform X4 [Fukomys damarensis]|uniref:uncharacterized protein LOC104854393 isoform X4 n=1 Tax=Fukomys damarensis TaxID=885580 RepID=UPI0008FF10D4|nr:uncharacterized protein LOC104854393 isoform X4 [Fukomys damarensis]